MVLQAEKFRNKGVTLIFIAGCYISKGVQVLGDCLDMRDCLERYTQLAVLSCCRRSLRSEKMTNCFPWVLERGVSV